MNPIASQETKTMQLSAVPAAPQQHLLCEECGAAVDAAQRYCVHCGARQGHADNPAVRYFASTARARRQLRVRPATGSTKPLIALLLCLLPVGVGLGVLVGRGNSDNAALLAALRNQKPIAVAVGGTGATGVAAGATTAAAKQATASKPAAVIAHTRYGTVHQIAGFKPTSQQLKQGASIVNRLAGDTGKTYISTQQNLPDTVVVPTGAGGGSAAQPSTGAAGQP